MWGNWVNAGPNKQWQAYKLSMADFFVCLFSIDTAENTEILFLGQSEKFLSH